MHCHDVERFAKLFERGFPLRRFAIDDQQSRVVGHVGYPSPDGAAAGSPDRAPQAGTLNESSCSRTS